MPLMVMSMLIDIELVVSSSYGPPGLSGPIGVAAAVYVDKARAVLKLDDVTVVEYGAAPDGIPSEERAVAEDDAGDRATRMAPTMPSSVPVNSDG